MTSDATTSAISRDFLVARMIRAGELEMTGEDQEELRSWFAPGYVFNGPGGATLDADGLFEFFTAMRAAFDNRSIRRGIIVVEGRTIACQTWIEGDFVNEFAASPIGVMQPNGAHITYYIHNFFEFDEQGRFVTDTVRYDNLDVLEQMGHPVTA